MPIASLPALFTSPSRDNNLQNLQQSLLIIRTHLIALETAISANITTQLLAISDVPVLDADSLPSFKVKKKNKESSAAVLNTVKVVCAVERGLEALVAALEMERNGVGNGRDGRDGNGERGERGLMEACLRRPEQVGAEMQRAVEGMRRVLKSKAPR
jgi:hypothetical protein